jgi:hypothetical protein
MRMRSVGPVVAVAVMTCVGLAADDKWERSQVIDSDDTSQTHNQLIHGDVQAHDLEGPARPNPTDVDFSYVAGKARHSYQVKVSSTNLCLHATNTVCAGLDRIADDGATLLTAGIAPDGARDGVAGWMAVRRMDPQARHTPPRWPSALGQAGVSDS